jgi:hypothetical protein
VSPAVENRSVVLVHIRYDYPSDTPLGSYPHALHALTGMSERSSLRQYQPLPNAEARPETLLGRTEIPAPPAKRLA